MHRWLAVIMRGAPSPGGRIVISVALFLIGFGADAAHVPGGHDVMTSALVILFLLLERPHPFRKKRTRTNGRPA